MKLIKYDIYSMLLLGIVVALACGIEVGESFQPSRVLIALSFLLVLRSRLTQLRRPLKLFIFMGGFWILWGILSLLWTPDFSAGAKQIIGISLGLATATLTALLLANARAGWDAVRRGWLTAFLVTIPIAWYEIATDHHLRSSLGHLESGGLDSFTVEYASVTFGNRNMYVAFICLALPVILCSLMQVRSFRWRLWYMLLAGTAAVLVIMDASRLGMLTLVIEWVLFSWINRKGKAGLRVLLFTVLFCLVGIEWFSNGVSKYTELRLTSVLMGGDESGKIRWNLFLNGVDLFEHSGGMGIGAGGFERSMISANMRHGTGGIVNAHNIWIGIASEYGVLVLSVFASWLVYSWFRIKASLPRINRLYADPSRQGLAYGFILIPNLPAIGLMNSDILTATMLWVAIGVVIHLASHNRQLLPNAVIRPLMFDTVTFSVRTELSV